jgi:transcriptional regulator with XRE-family HTH domain
VNVKAIREQCEKQGISQNELARRTGVSVAHMSNVMNQKRDAHVELLKKMCELFGVKAEEIW